VSAKSLPKDLLEQAKFLTTKETKKPKQATLRRAVSTAYYSLFHLLCSEAVEIMAPNVDENTRYRMQRWFDHIAMKETCGRFLPPSLGAPLRDLIGSVASNDLQRVARNFIRLQDARHLADYDMGWTLTRIKSQEFVQEAEDAREAWLRIRKTAEANIFALSFLHWKHWEKRT
jgi:hypothetical protein